jgi:hypothetical protein
MHTLVRGVTVASRPWMPSPRTWSIDPGGLVRIAPWDISAQAEYATQPMVLSDPFRDISAQAE